ncbi:hypothetical protein HK103_006243 [Boothiomyces macroporosus]|uniref:Uncharacterized protein n=1 Tax=Boothiomyces macroporosus TaxID=261099 RepID=A0AAD5UEP1_9FUNG|nr:hypothetical protein HK103_006243 [Boothiomyces macroporosus]
MNTFIPAEHFIDYIVQDQKICLNLNRFREILEFFECVNIEIRDAELILWFENTRAKLLLYDEIQVDLLDEIFNSFETESKIILKSEYLLDAIQEIDSTCSEIIFSISDSFVIKTIGLIGKSVIQCNNLESIESKPAELRFTFSQFKHTFKALGISTRTCIRINSVGMMFLQFMIPATDSFTFVDFIVTIFNSSLILSKTELVKPLVRLVNQH